MHPMHPMQPGLAQSASLGAAPCTRSGGRVLIRPQSVPQKEQTLDPGPPSSSAQAQPGEQLRPVWSEHAGTCRRRSARRSRGWPAPDLSTSALGEIRRSVSACTSGGPMEKPRPSYKGGSVAARATPVNGSSAAALQVSPVLGSSAAAPCSARSSAKASGARCLRAVCRPTTRAQGSGAAAFFSGWRAATTAPTPSSRE